MNRKEYLLTCLTEECSEIIKEVSKSLRFGLYDHEPGSDLMNCQRVSEEICDLLAVWEILVNENILPFVDKEVLIQKKIKKLKKWMEYSKEIKCLEDE